MVNQFDRFTSLPENDSIDSATGWQGCLELAYARRQDRTELIRSRVQAPLKVQRSFYPEGSEVCHNVILHTAGGVVGGDRLTLNIDLDAQAHALITTAAAAKIYRSTGAEAQQIVHIRLAEAACLEWFPQETIVFNGAKYKQNTRIELADRALWLGWEITRLGRSARGEQFLQGEWRSHTEVWQQGRPLWIDPQWLQGGSEMLNSLNGLAGYPVVGSFAAIGQPVTADLVEAARQLWTKQMCPGEAGVTRLMTGLLCRYRGHSTLEARRWFTEVWNLLRQSWLDRSICKPRVWT
jgi:urease accessory protein